MPPSGPVCGPCHSERRKERGRPPSASAALLPPGGDATSAERAQRPRSRVTGRQRAGRHRAAGAGTCEDAGSGRENGQGSGEPSVGGEALDGAAAGTGGGRAGLTAGTSGALGSRAESSVPKKACAGGPIAHRTGRRRRAGKAGTRRPATNASRWRLGAGSEQKAYESSGGISICRAWRRAGGR